MVKISKYKYPNNLYIYGEYTEKSIFQKNKFTHIICPLFTIYRVDLAMYLDTMYEWLVHKGYLGIVTMNNEFHISQIQNLKPSKLLTLNYDYTIELKNNMLLETLTNKQGYKRTNKLELKDISNLEEDAKITGFKLIQIFDIPNNKGLKLHLFQKK